MTDIRWPGGTPKRCGEAVQDPTNLDRKENKQSFMDRTVLVPRSLCFFVCDTILNSFAVKYQ